MIRIGVILYVVLHIATLLISTSSANPYYAHDFRVPLKGQGDRSLKNYTEALAVCRERGGTMVTMHTPELHQMTVDQLFSQLENLHHYFIDLLWSYNKRRYYWSNLDSYSPNQGYINGFYFEVPTQFRGCVGFIKYPTRLSLRPISCDRRADVLCLIPNPNKVTTTTTTATTTTTTTTTRISTTTAGTIITASTAGTMNTVDTADTIPTTTNSIENKTLTEMREDLTTTNETNSALPTGDSTSGVLFLLVGVGLVFTIFIFSIAGKQKDQVKYKSANEETSKPLGSSVNSYSEIYSEPISVKKT